jgi:hypothetical protein
VKDLYIVIPNWGKFQHYKDRRPVWIKLYTELNSRDDWLELSDAERGLLATIWIEYARSGGRLRLSTVRSLVRSNRQWNARTYVRFTARIERLNHAGFIRLSASPEVELLLEKTSTLGAKQETPDFKEDVKTFLDDVTHSLRAMPA